MGHHLTKPQKIGAGAGCLLLIVILFLGLSGTLRRWTLEDHPPTEYQSQPANHATITCPADRFDVFQDTARQFAQEKKLAYQGRADNESGTKFVITLTNMRQDIALTAADSPAMLSQHLAAGVTSSAGDKQLFNDLLGRLARC